MPSPWYINADIGNDGAGDGSSGNPWETLAFAFTSSGADDTIVCQDSTAAYAFVNGTFDHNITIQGEQDDASGAVFDGGGANVMWTLDADVALEMLTIRNIVITSINNTALSVEANRTVSIDDCVIHDITQTTVSGGVVLQSAPGGDLITVNITNTLIYDLDDAVGGNNGVFTYYVGGSKIVAINITGCTIYSGDVPILGTHFLGGNACSFVATNSIMEATTSAVFERNNGAGSVTRTATYSCIFNYTGSPAGTGTITVDPLFVDPDNGDFNLRPASPCIDTGVLV